MAAICRRAIDMLNGVCSPTDGQKANAFKALCNPESEVTRFAWYCAFDATINSIVDAGNDPSDANVQTVVDLRADAAWAVAIGFKF